jgi:hypothetical protein
MLRSDRKPKYRTHSMRGYLIAYSYEAYMDGTWPRLEWGVFDADKDLLRSFRTLREARSWVLGREA